MTDSSVVRWGILSTANIAKGSFLPALRAAGGGVAAVVAGRDRERAQAFADANGVERAVEGYDALIADDSIDAIYNPLPNALHAQWTIAALEAEKAVLCEKPLTERLEETDRVLAVARERAGLLWEAFVYPWRRQTARLMEIIRAGTIGEVREIAGTFHFTPSVRENNIRFSADLGGGALLDVGCYPISVARFVLGAEAVGALATATMAPEGVDEEIRGILDFPAGRRLIFSCSMNLPQNTVMQILGTEGQIQLTNPYHPGPSDTLSVQSGEDSFVERFEDETGPSFTGAVRHIHSVLRGQQSPQHTATEDAGGNAVAIDLVFRSARSGRYESL